MFQVKLWRWKFSTPQFVRTIVFNPKVLSDAALLDRTMELTVIHLDALLDWTIALTKLCGWTQKFVRTLGFNPIVRSVVWPNYVVDQTMGLNPKVRTNFGVEIFNVTVWLETSSRYFIIIIIIIIIIKDALFRKDHVIYIGHFIKGQLYIYVLMIRTEYPWIFASGEINSKVRSLLNRTIVLNDPWCYHCSYELVCWIFLAP